MSESESDNQGAQQPANGGAEGPPSDAHGITISPERRRYAAILKHGVRLAFVVLVGSYLIYVLGLVDPHVPPSELAQHWHKSADEYTEALGYPRGWNWVYLLHESDVMSYLGVVMLGLLSIVAMASLVPTYVLRRRWLMAGIVGLQILVLVLAASGVLDVGA